jgi:hypothetical protein
MSLYQRYRFAFTGGAVILGVAALAACATADAGAPEAMVYKSPTCGCCSQWAEHLEAAGFKVRTEDVDDMMAVKLEHGITSQLASCHTAIIDGYVVEGHVPADAIMRMLDERPDIVGLAVPGMPIGSPGMEGAIVENYDILAFDEDGNTQVYESR